MHHGWVVVLVLFSLLGCASEERVTHKRVTLSSGAVVDCHALYWRRDTVVCRYFARPGDRIDTSVTWMRGEVVKVDPTPLQRGG